MRKEKFEILIQNVKNTPSCDLPKNQLYDVSFTMTMRQLKEFANVLYNKGIVSYDYGHAYIGNNMLF